MTEGQQGQPGTDEPDAAPDVCFQTGSRSSPLPEAKALPGSRTGSLGPAFCQTVNQGVLKDGADLQTESKDDSWEDSNLLLRLVTKRLAVVPVFRTIGVLHIFLNLWHGRFETW
jgi:hypothetical protein